MQALFSKWLGDPCFAPVAQEVLDDDVFLPVEIEAGVVHDRPPSEVPAPPSSPASLCASRVDITLSDGRHILVEGSTGLTAVVSLVQGLTV